jgi:hypothetical protein
MIKLTLALIGLISFFLHGYYFSTGDQSTYVPQVLKRVDPKLFQRDYLAQTAEGDLSFMFPLMAAIIKTTNIDIEWLYFLLYVAIRLFIIFAIYQLSFTLTKSRPTALLASLILSLPKFVAGTNQPTLDNSLLPRFLGLPLLLLGLNYLAQFRFVVAGFLTGLIFTLHPYSAVYLGLFLLACLVGFRQPWSTWLKAVLAGLASSSWFLIQSLPQYLGRNSQLIMDQDWFNIISQRLPYNLISRWPVIAWIALAIPLIGIWFYHSRWLITSVITAVIITLIHVIFGEIFKLALIFQLQLPRIWLIPTYFGYIAWAKVLTRRWILIPLTLLLIFNFGKFRPSSIEWPQSYSREWDQVQLWARSNTPPNALFLTPATRIGFRIRSHRAIVAEIKDGSSGLYSRQLAFDWQNRVNDLGLINLKTEAEIKSLQKKYAADYLVTFNNAIYSDFTPVLKTDTFLVYKL